jgi:hypothetical protein
VPKIFAMIYHLLDVFFVVFHTSLIIFNLTGWIFRKLRVWNLVTLLVTGSSWLILGPILGIPGYCPLTDWHFSVLEKLGKTDLPSSYIEYLAERLTGHDIDSAFADKLTMIVFIIALAVSVIINLAGFFRKKGKAE